MEKKTISLMTILLVTFMCVSLASCRKNKDDDNPFVGSWSCNNHYYGGSYGGVDTYIFKSNGTFEWSCTGDWWDDLSGNYSYDEGNGVLTIHRKVTEVYYIISLTNTSFTMMDEDGDYYTYYKN